ncbi:LYR motif-containing protein At3g19508-like [Tasmannia lanceolata]|uniref:LYR motif-containing protein At3g19508-like n=1 Tax=Tasmannia lanceolata TaxID=3420 RepID=UPI0040645110
MERALRAYGAVLRLVRHLPKDSRPYYSKYARENFVNYRELDDPKALDELLRRTYDHSTWVLKKYSVDKSAAATLKEICGS